MAPPDAPRMDIHQRIRHLRESRNLEQADVADAIGWSRPMISAVENGRKKPGRDLLRALATYYGVSMDWIESGTDSSKAADLAARIALAPPDIQAAIMTLLAASEGTRRGT
jgi:transcriptional regulator with XRE-family HTH domain